MAERSGMRQKIYDFVEDFVRERGYPPSVREIGAAVGLSSPSTVYFHLKRLEEDGLIARSAGKGRALSLRSRTAGNRDEPAPIPADRVPVVGDVAAGSPILAQELVEEYLAFDTGGRPEEYFALRVRGESMLNAGILPDDLVVVRRQEHANSGEIVVAMLGEEATVKRLSLRKDGVWLLPENDDYDPIDGTGAQILGKVAAVVRRY